MGLESGPPASWVSEIGPMWVRRTLRGVIVTQSDATIVQTDSLVSGEIKRNETMSKRSDEYFAFECVLLYVNEQTGSGGGV